MKKRLSLLLACVALCTLFASCDKNDKPVETTADTVATTEKSPDTPDLPDPSSIDIAGDFNILVAGNWAWNDFASETIEGNVVDAAICRRNEYMLSKYGVKIQNEDIVRFNSSGGTGDGYVKLYTEYMAGDHSYDAAMVGTYDVATLAYNGYIHDLNEIEHLDLSKSYWDQKANEDLSMNGKMFYTTGDISVADNRSTHALFFNKEMIKMYGMENPYDLVRSGEWTLETFGEMVKQVGSDDNNDGIYDKNDTFGLFSARDNNLAMLAAAGEKICTINDRGQLELTLYNERVVNLYDRYLPIVDDDAHTFNWQYNYITNERATQASNAERIGMFDNNRCLFYFHMLFYVDEMRDIQTDFGILPFPKYDAAQESYGHYVSAWHSQFLCVPKTVQDLARTGIVLEELAYQGKQMLTPAYYEKTLVGQRTRDEESVDMLDLIFATRVYDVGIYYNIGTYKDQIGNFLETGQSLTTIYETYRGAAEVKIQEINDFFAQNTGESGGQQ